MFVRYLGGGVGHLKQFPPADSDNEDAAAHNNDTIEVEPDEFIANRNSTEHNSSDEGYEGEEDYESEEDDRDNNEGEGDEDDGEDEEDEGVEDAADDVLDEETGNVY
jgi:hypothetical protein